MKISNSVLNLVYQKEPDFWTYGIHRHNLFVLHRILIAFSRLCISRQKQSQALCPQFSYRDLCHKSQVYGMVQLPNKRASQTQSQYNHLMLQFVFQNYIKQSMAHLELGCKVIKKAALRLNFAASLGHAKAKEKCRRQVPKKGVLICRAALRDKTLSEKTWSLTQDVGSK